ncbi:DUF4136 domain-containing protein [Sulfurovum sp.]|uniref:DUF4136 domain-containing protein n=1 Tax=Sulfurovum sp. TaxID=1969726 RepID=UPI002867E954|nr:DUF4136 domain-containing protein [Sulfurovum sp.]
MLKSLKGVIVCLMIIGMTGCVNTSDIKVESAQDEKVNLDGYKTYQILNESGMVTEPVVTNLDMDTELQRLINTELGNKGKTPVTSNPDFYIAYLAGADMDAMKVKVDSKGQETLDNVPEAAMILLLIDARTSMIIGVSTAEGEVKDIPLEDRKKRLKYTIEKMLGGL